jgi:hypothetical protein
MPGKSIDLLYDLALAPFVAVAAAPMRLVRRVSVARIPITFAILKRAGVFPLRGHYYEPLFDTSSLHKDGAPRDLPGIDFAMERQTALLEEFKDLNDIEALKLLPTAETHEKTFYIKNGNFESGDAEIWFHVIRHFKPAKIIEIGSGHSTRMATIAIGQIKKDDPAYHCEHVCIEPYEMPWLEELGVQVLRTKLEDVDPSMIETLAANDILFIDSSHIIRPQGEVLYEFLQIIPRLGPGVIVHVHDIFSPRDYPMEWLQAPRFWNEQYLLEAFLTNNSKWETLLAVNMLKHEQYDQLKAVCPHLDENREPGSFYMRRR